MNSHEYYSTRSRHYQLPIIILSVICGSGNFVSTSFPDNQDNIILGVGVLSIITSIISSVAQYLKLAEKSEAHRIASVSWEKFYNNIRFQLSKRREEREDIQNYILSTTGEYQRLQEISPLLPTEIVSKFRSRSRKIVSHMNVPVALRDIKPTSWWNDDKNNLITIEPEVHVANAKKKHRRGLFGGTNKDDESETSDEISTSTLDHTSYEITETSQIKEAVNISDSDNEDIVVLNNITSTKTSSI
tara:strand:- start:353 stop:1087 length:735 start_codon:yes stop_codon:yes gene_type:complete